MKYTYGQSWTMVADFALTQNYDHSALRPVMTLTI